MKLEDSQSANRSRDGSRFSLLTLGLPVYGIGVRASEIDILDWFKRHGEKEGRLGKKVSEHAVGHE